MNKNNDSAGAFDEGCMSEEMVSVLESRIFSAGRYVVPSDELRPKTLEAARDKCSDRQTQHRLVRFAWVMLFCGCLSVPVVGHMEVWRNQLHFPDSSELDLQSMRIAREKGTTPQWGLQEAFTELRSVQATRLGKVSP